MSQQALEGCEYCRRGANSATWPPPSRIATSADGWAFLHRCGECGAYWEFNVREAHVIGEAEARQHYPDTLDASGGSDTRKL